jgi:hypothetical protein
MTPDTTRGGSRRRAKAYSREMDAEALTSIFEALALVDRHQRHGVQAFVYIQGSRPVLRAPGRMSQVERHRVLDLGEPPALRVSRVDRKQAVAADEVEHLLDDHTGLRRIDRCRVTALEVEGEVVERPAQPRLFGVVGPVRSSFADRPVSSS